MNAQACPCGSRRSYAACCGQFHGSVAAPDAASLMRSRYSAFVLGREDYLLASWHPDTRPVGLKLDVTPLPQWLGLAIESHVQQDQNHATVEFVARYKLNGRAFKIHEISRFERVAGRWLYVDGKIRE